MSTSPGGAASETLRQRSWLMMDYHRQILTRRNVGRVCTCAVDRPETYDVHDLDEIVRALATCPVHKPVEYGRIAPRVEGPYCVVISSVRQRRHAALVGAPTTVCGQPLSERRLRPATAGDAVTCRRCQHGLELRGIGA